MGFTPTSVFFNAYGWKGGNFYNVFDIPIAPGSVDRVTLEQQYAYEWFDSYNSLGTRRNPPFAQGTAGRLAPPLADAGISNRILRGFIRRAEYDRADEKSTARLYFLYNPETITRDYVSYLGLRVLRPRGAQRGAGVQPQLDQHHPAGQRRDDGQPP
jgi:hypothetical protein